MNLQNELGQEPGDGAGDEPAQQSWSDQMRQKAAGVPKALGASVRSGQSAAQSLAFNVNALRAGLDALPPGQEEIVLEVDDDGVQHINT